MCNVFLSGDKNKKTGNRKNFCQWEINKLGYKHSTESYKQDKINLFSLNMSTWMRGRDMMLTKKKKLLPFT